MRSAKIVLTVLFCSALAAHAETLEGLSRRIDDIVKGRNNGAQIQTLTVRDSATVDSRAVVTAPSTTAKVVDHGTCTNGQATVTFTAAFGAAPNVILTWKDAIITAPAAGTNLTLSASSITASNFVPKVAALPVGGAYTNIQWIAVGTAP
jgi:hypothetical protein